MSIAHHVIDVYRTRRSVRNEQDAEDAATGPAAGVRGLHGLPAVPGGTQGLARAEVRLLTFQIIGYVGIVFTILCAASIAVYAFIDPEWSIPLNTALLIILALIQRRTLKRAEEAQSEIHRTRKAAQAGTDALMEATGTERRSESRPSGERDE